MKPAAWIAVLMGLVGAGAVTAPRLLVQAQPAAPPRTKVAVIYLRAVLRANDRARALKADLEEALKGPKGRAKILADEIDALSASKKPDAAALARKKAEWEALNASVVSLIEKTHQDKMPAVWEEIQEAMNAAAKGHGFQIVLGHCDPDDPEVKAFQSVRSSHVRAADMGCTFAAYVHGSVDLTPVVIEMLRANRMK